MDQGDFVDSVVSKLGVFLSSILFVNFLLFLTYLLSLALKIPFGELMRRRGAGLFYVPFLVLFTINYRHYLVEDITDKESPPEYPWYWSLYLWTLRASAIFQLIPSLAFVGLYFFNPVPPLPDPATRDFSQRPESSFLLDNNNEKKFRLPCFVIRIITRGDYPNLIKRSVTHHIRLMEQHCDFDRLEAHVVTEKPLHGDYEVGKTGFVREILVPVDYRPPSLHKCRNLNYYMHNVPKCLQKTPAEKIWTLSLDEDSFVDETFAKAFLENFIPSGAHCGVLPGVIDLPQSASVLNGFEESFFFTLQSIGMWFEAAVMKKTPVWFRGGVYLVRFDVEKKIGYDFTPEMSLAEDQAFSHIFADNGYKIGYINGWSWEGGAPNLMGLIRQRARWLRGVARVLWNTPMSVPTRAWRYFRLVQIFVVNGAVMTCAIVQVTTWLLSMQPFRPVGSSVWFLDYAAPFVASSIFYSSIYGSWFTLSTQQAVVVTVLSNSLTGILITFLIHYTTLVWSIVSVIKDLTFGEHIYEVTVKKDG